MNNLDQVSSLEFTSEKHGWFMTNSTCIHRHEQSDFDQAAEKQCGRRNYSLISIGFDFTGDTTFSSGMSGNLRIKSEKEKCYVYECK